MTVTVSPLTTSAGTRYDQMIEARNKVRAHFEAHPGEDRVRFEVTWNDGEVEALTFLRSTLLPEGLTHQMMLDEWTREEDK